MTIDDAELRRLGLSWNAEGMLGFSGPLYQLLQSIDRALLELAQKLGAEEHAFLPPVAVRDLRRIDFFSSFPHLCMLPATPADAEAFRQANSSDGPLALAQTAPVEAVLSTAACYPVYPALAGATLPKRVTVLGTCFRREERHERLVRQWCFRMREVVYLGDASGAAAFLDEARALSRSFAVGLGVTISLGAATDPFFDPARSPRYLHQKLFPTKEEMISDGVALGSLNYHRSFFGEAFGLSAGGSPAHTACVAFGLERWVHAILATHGSDPERWPRF
jgi:seryl-tRNA synthetase